MMNEWKEHAYLCFVIHTPSQKIKIKSGRLKAHKNVVGHIS